MVKVSIPMKSTKKLPISFKFILPSKRFKLPLLRKRCPYSEFFWSSFFRIRTKYGEIYLSVLSRNAGKYGPQKLLRRTLFTQCVTIVSFIIICLHCFLFIYIYMYIYIYIYNIPISFPGAVASNSVLKEN